VGDFGKCAIQIGLFQAQLALAMGMLHGLIMPLHYTAIE